MELKCVLGWDQVAQLRRAGVVGFRARAGAGAGGAGAGAGVDGQVEPCWGRPRLDWGQQAGTQLPCWCQHRSVPAAALSYVLR